MQPPRPSSFLSLRREKRVHGRLVEAYQWLDPLRVEEFFDGERWWRLAHDPERPSRTPVGVTDSASSFLIVAGQLGTPIALAELDENIV